LEAKVNYKISDDNSNLKSEGEAKAILEEDGLTLKVAFGEPILLSYTDIVGISEGDYKVDLFLTSKEMLSIWGLGYQYEDFLFQLFRFRSELLLKHLLMEEALLNSGTEAHFNWINSAGDIVQIGDCELRLYDNAFVVLPNKGEPIRFPYCYISQVTKADYKLIVADESGGKIEFSRFGERFEPFSKAFSDALNKMMLRTQETIKELLPEADSRTVSKLATLMKDGRAAKRKDLESIASDFWIRLTQRIKEANIDPEYEFLNALAEKDQVRVGLKRGLMGSITGSYIWLLFPLHHPGSNKLSNAVALEAFNTQETQANIENSETEDVADETLKDDQTSLTKGATYFFKIMDRRAYEQAKAEDIATALENSAKNVEHALIDTNFRREPIYLSEDQLSTSKYVQYLYAIAKMPSLKALRNLFIGRVFHLNTEQWKTDVTSLLAFNAKSLNDTEKWKKGDT
jgi:hypothetical protein